MSTDGWIPREQPRGDELRSYIPGLKENKLESNPPTFFFNFELLMQNFPNDAELMSRISVLYPKLKLWYQSWFSTQVRLNIDCRLSTNRVYLPVS
jgi:mannosyl-oligosaccharide glucosidase